MSWAEPSSTHRPDSVPVDQGQATVTKRRDLRRHWSKVASMLPRGASVLEVGAGSGLVSKWLVAFRPDIHAVATDCGAYPVDLEELGPIRFHGKTWLEALPFADSGFSAVVAQFAFEYADRARALRECARVLGGRGLLSFVMHADSGALHAGCKLRVEAINMLCEDPSLPELLRKASAISDLKLRSTMVALSTGAVLADRRARLEDLEAAAGVKSSGLRSYLDNAAMMIGRADFAAWVERANEQLREDLFVGSDQLRAALSQADVEELSTLAGKLGLVVTKAERRDFYWVWSATKTGSPV